MCIFGVAAGERTITIEDRRSVLDEVLYVMVMVDCDWCDWRQTVYPIEN